MVPIHGPIHVRWSSRLAGDFGQCCGGIGVVGVLGSPQASVCA